MISDRSVSCRLPRFATRDTIAAVFTRPLQLAAVLLAATLYWIGVCELEEVTEPWDADRYWAFWYPLAIALSAAIGFFASGTGWPTGVIVIAAQLPVMWLYAGTGPLVVLGIMMIMVLALPAAIASLLGSLAAQRRR